MTLWIYALLLSVRGDTAMPFWHRWERDLAITLSEVERMKIAQHVFKDARSIRHQEFGYKLLTWWYCTPSSMSKMYLGNPTAAGDAEGGRETSYTSFGRVH